MENEKLKFVKLFLEEKTRIARGNFFSFPFKLESLQKTLTETVNWTFSTSREIQNKNKRKKPQIYSQ